MNDLGEEVLQKVKNITQKCFNAVEDFAHLSKGQWLLMMQLININDLIHNYKIKLNDLQVDYEERNSRLLLVMNCLLEF
jgi:DNA-directed RNA polymerase subunit beta